MMRSRSDLPPIDPQPWAALIAPDSFYARLADVRDVLVDDEVYRPLYKDSAKGRPSLPPSLVVLTMLLQYHDDCSDRETEAQVRFDLRWKHALGLGLEDQGFDATVLSVFRRKLLQHGLTRVLFDRLISAAQEAGLLTKTADQVIDSSHILGAAGVRDTYTLIRGGIRKLLRALGYTPGRHQELGERLDWYLDPEAPEKPELDWSDAAERAEHLRQLVEDAREALRLVPTDEQRAAVQEAAALLTKIVADDVEEGPPSGPKRRGRPPTNEEPVPPVVDGEAETPVEEPGPRLRQGVARDRVLSVVDPAMRYGHKSQRQHWPGYKMQVSEEPGSELITHVEVRPANEYDGEPVVGFMARQEAQVGLRPDTLLCDGAYGTADARAALGERGIEVVAKLRPITDTKHLGKDQFTIDLAANDGQGSVTCPAGRTTTDFRMARDNKDRAVRLFRFPAETCATCSLRDRCLGGPGGRAEHPVRKPPGRQVQLHVHEDVLQAARAAQKTPEQRQALRNRLRPRAKIERKISELCQRHGLRHGRYRGQQKTDLQAVLTATMVNTKRLLRLASTEAERGERIRTALAA
jgi:transposase